MNTQKKYSNSVKIFYPKYNKEQVIKELKKYTKKLREKLGLEKVMLFGSYAKENYTVASDIDLLIIYNDKKTSEDEVYKHIMKSIKLPRIELHLIPKKSLKTYKKTKWMKTIEKEGIKIL